MTTNPLSKSNHTADAPTIPQGSHEPLSRLRAHVGAVPNLATAMAQSPALIDAFVTMRERFQLNATLAPADRELVSLTNAVENECSYCTAIHTAFSLKEGAAAESVEAVRKGGTPADGQHAALVDFARALLRQRGRVSAEELASFLDAGYSRDQVLELIVIAALSTLANYSGRFTQTTLDEFLAPHAVVAAPGASRR